MNDGSSYNPFKDIPTTNYSLVGDNGVSAGYGKIDSVNTAYHHVTGSLQPRPEADANQIYQDMKSELENARAQSR